MTDLVLRRIAAWLFAMALVLGAMWDTDLRYPGACEARHSAVRR